MNKIRSIIILFVLCLVIINTAKASIHSYTDYIYPEFHLNICYNNYYVSLEDLLYYKGVSVLLSEYVEQKIKEEKLDADRKVHIRIGCTVFGGLPSVQMYRSKAEYYFFAHSLPQLDYLVKVIDYFASPDWESFYYEEESKYEAARKTFNKRIEKYADTNSMRFFADKPVVVYSVGELQIIYLNDTLQVFIDTTKLPVNNLGSIPPVQFKDRYIIFETDRFLVYENDVIILEYKIEEDEYENWRSDYFTEGYADWLNVYDNSRGNPIYSYCYSKNKFYTVRR